MTSSPARVPTEASTWAELAASAGVVIDIEPHRRWVQSASAGHVSGWFVGGDPASVVLVHDAGDQSNGWDEVTLHLGMASVAVDLPGHGRSSSAPTLGRPNQRAAGLLDAIWSFASGVELVVATGFGAAVALRAAVRRPELVPHLVIVDGGPVASGIGHVADPDGVADDAEAAAILATAAPRRRPEFIAHLAVACTEVRGDGRREWRFQPTPIDPAAWSSIDDLAHLEVAPTTLTVITAAPAGSAPIDPFAAAVHERFPTTSRVQLDGPADDLLGGSSPALAAALRALLDNARDQRPSSPFT